MMHAVMSKTMLKRIITLAGIVSEDVLNIQYMKEGWKVEKVDAAHVAMIYIMVGKEVMDDYSLDFATENDCRTQIPMRKLSEALSTMIDDTPISLTDDGTFVAVDCGKIHRRIRKHGEYETSRIPELNNPCSIKIDINEILAMVSKGISISDHIMISCGHDGLKILLQGDTESASYEDQENVSPDGEDYKSSFPLDYLTTALKAFGGEVIFELANDYPLKIMAMTPFPSTYLLAPRVEESDGE